MEGKPILYSFWRSSCAFRVRIALLLKNIPYEYRSIGLSEDRNEQFSENYKKINPMMQVPSFSFQKNGKQHTIIQSVAIVELLEELVPNFALLPKDPIDRAHIRSIVETIASGIQPLQNLESMKMVNDNRLEYPEFANRVLTKKFHSLEALLKKFAGKYSYGDKITMADVFLVPQVYNSFRYNVDKVKDQFPTIFRVYDELKKIPAFQDSWPENMPDAPESVKGKLAYF